MFSKKDLRQALMKEYLCST